MMWFLHYYCKLKVCRNRRVKGSEYCESHICKEWHHNRNCDKRGKGYNGFCPNHANCVKQHGGRRCGRPRKKLDTEYKYCSEIHGCQEDDCKAPNLGSRSANVISRWCINHACGNTDCAEPRAGGGQGCKDHTCHAEGCVLTVPGTKDEDKSKVENYCPGHRTCNKGGCANPIFVHNSNRNSRFCFEHFCKPGGGAAGGGGGGGGGSCDKERVDGDGAEACEDHTCARYHLNRACCRPKAAPAGGGLYCADHECSRDGCRKERFAAKDWCAEHLCSSPLELREDCANEREGGTGGTGADAGVNANANQIYCKDHRPCEEPGCREFRAFKGNNVRGEKCEEHSKPRCRFPNCALAPDGEGAAGFCAAHLCQYGQGCRQAPIAGTPICWMHKCAEPLCLSPRIAPPVSVPAPPLFLSSTPPPPSAAADSAAAAMMMTMMMLQGGRLGSYCHAHTCRARGCVRKVFVPSAASASAAAPPFKSCADAGRNRDRDRDRDRARARRRDRDRDRDRDPEYCDEHKCRERDCLAAGEAGSGGYCRDHDEDGDGDGDWDGDGWGTTMGEGGGGWGSRLGGPRKNYYRAIRW